MEDVGTPYDAGDCLGNTGLILLKNSAATRRLVEMWASPSRCAEEELRWRAADVSADLVERMRSWCSQDNDQDAFNRILITERIFASSGHPGVYGNVLIVGARQLNRFMHPGDPHCLFNGSLCHMYGQNAGFRSIVLRYVLDCTRRFFGL